MSEVSEIEDWMKKRNSELYHYGIKGMKWGVRRYQNKDGSLIGSRKKRHASNKEIEDFKLKVKKARSKEVENDELEREMDKCERGIEERVESVIKRYDSLKTRYDSNTKYINDVKNQINSLKKSDLNKINESIKDTNVKKWSSTPYKDAETRIKELTDDLFIDYPTINFTGNRTIDYALSEQVDRAKKWIEKRFKS